MDNDFGLWEVIVSMFWFMLLIAWIWLIIAILADIFRDRTLSGGWKALWVVFLIFLPWLGALIYLIARGGSMHERAAQQAQRNEEQFRSYVQQAAASGPSTAEELKKLADLRDAGTITAADYEAAKAKLLA
jgi:type II secretory pathway component PulL